MGYYTWNTFALMLLVLCCVETTISSGTPSRGHVRPPMVRIDAGTRSRYGFRGRHGIHANRQIRKRSLRKEELLKRSEVIKNILLNYDNRISPHFDPDVPTKVKVHMYVNSFDSIRESSMDFSMNFIITQKWNDPRLKFSTGTDENLELDTKFMDRIWVPDLYFANEKEANFHNITVPNRMMHLHADGTVQYRVRLTMTATCPMKLEKFPLDIQTCSIFIKSFVYTPDNVVFEWDDGSAVTHNRQMELSQFTISNITFGDCHRDYEENNFTCISTSFHLQRKYAYYMLHAYLPSTLIVVISWLSFWLPTESTAARISLSSLTILTMITQRQSNSGDLPPVSYIKAIDIWTVACLLFVFAAFVEYTLVCFFSRQDCHVLTISLTGAKESIFATSSNQSPKDTDIGITNVQEGASDNPYTLDNDNVTLDVTVPNPKAKQRAKRVDVISRVVFPTLFAIFLIPYWSIYLR
ncbi:glycine receptor subunit alpha-2 isoform X3 [Octopus bimaculoides]|nr:glycine receptor subunit alpha-2 isoform X3 [Octopus bimaculoides]